jgi:hypothetical protein
MEFKVLKASFENREFKIEEDYPEVGVYLYVFEDGECTRDSLQNDIETCKKIAYEDYKVPIDAWTLAEDKKASP